MASLKKLLMAATALTMVSSVAFAQSDEAYSDQTGSRNDLLIDQSGEDNFADVTQSGDDNTGNVLQSGDGNKAGNSANGNVQQLGDDNIFDIKQTSDDNTVGMIRQTGEANGGATAGPAQNKLTILQESSGSTEDGSTENYVGTVLQNNNAAASNDVNTVTLTQTGAENRVSRVDQAGSNNLVDTDQIGNGNSISLIEQTGIGNSAVVGQGITVGIRVGPQDDNRIVTLRQVGGNSATIRQTHGDANEIILIEQTNTSGTSSAGNFITFSQFGSDNGTAGFKARAASASVGEAMLIQTGINNAITASEIGNSNVSGFSQIGDFNTASGTILGNDNSFAMSVLGDGNVVFFGQNGAQSHLDGNRNDAGIVIVGDDNNVPTLPLDVFVGANPSTIRQDGNDNAALLKIFGSENVAGIRQTGNRNDAFTTINDDAQNGGSGDGNELTTYQLGDDNFAELSISGDDNVANLKQTGTFNSFDLVVNGDENGGAHTFGDNDAGGIGLTAGLFEQNGVDNSFEALVIGSDNVLAATQNGDDNQMSGEVSGDANQVAVSQAGNSNIANFSQTGSNNVVGISQ